MVCAVLRAYASGRLFGESFGREAAWVLALHGWARTHQDFAAALGDLGVDGTALDAIAIDLPGFGATPPPPRRWGSPEYAAAVAEVLDELPGAIVVVGHSFGGRVAVHLAALRPERVAGLVLTGAPLLRAASARPARRYRAVRALARAGLVGEARLERARGRYGSADYRASSGVMREVLVASIGEEYGAVLRAISCPVALLWGELDRDVPVEVATELAAVLGGPAPTVLAGIGHLVPTEAPQALRKLILDMRP